MPQQKDFKRVVRTRMQKTGELYTTRVFISSKNNRRGACCSSENYAALAKLATSR